MLSEAEREAVGCDESDRGTPRVRRVLVILAVLGVCAAAFVLAGASDQKSEGRTYKLVFDNAFGLVKGGDFRVGGVNAGQTTRLRRREEEGRVAQGDRDRRGHEARASGTSARTRAARSGRSR